MKSLLLATTVLAIFTTGAMAADAVLPVASTYNWTGGYIGAQIGHGWGDSRYENSYTDYANYDPSGFMGGIYAGYSHQFENNLVVGVDADFAWTNMGDDEPYYYEGVLSSSYSVDSKVKWTGAVRARLGYAMERWLPYVAAGLSVAKYQFSLQDSGAIEFDETRTMTGWNIGAGVEYAATDNLIIRAEYRYSDFGKKDLGDLWDGEDWSTINLRSHDLRLGVAYKF